MLSYKNDLSSAEQAKLDVLIADKDMTNKAVLLVTEEFEIVDKDNFRYSFLRIVEIIFRLCYIDICR